MVSIFKTAKYKADPSDFEGALAGCERCGKLMIMHYVLWSDNKSCDQKGRDCQLVPVSGSAACRLQKNLWVESG